jgi:N-acetylglucosaminyldiphosphoundecaprenol N-acetyl-beta-D-mannosaminyltransferase
MTEPPAIDRPRLRIGRLWIDAIGFDDALDAIERLVDRGQGGAVFTPNVDHVVKAESNGAFREAYTGVSLSLADGMPLVWVGRLLGCRLPERVAGSDLLVPLMKRAARRKWRVYLLGGKPGSAETAARVLAEEYGVITAGWDDCRIAADGTDVDGHDSAARVRAAKPDLILVGLGPPKQELWIHRTAESLRPAVGLGIGAGLDFLAGRHKRAPRWMAKSGLEWAFRLAQEPRRLWRRYLVESPRFAAIVLATRLSPRSTRVQEPQPSSRNGPERRLTDAE